MKVKQYQQPSSLGSPGGPPPKELPGLHEALRRCRALPVTDRVPRDKGPPSPRFPGWGPPGARACASRGPAKSLQTATWTVSCGLHMELCNFSHILPLTKFCLGNNRDLRLGGLTAFDIVFIETGPSSVKQKCGSGPEDRWTHLTLLLWMLCLGWADQLVPINMPCG